MACHGCLISPTYEENYGTRSEAESLGHSRTSHKPLFRGGFAIEMTQFLNQMMKLPLAIFVYSLEMLTKTMQDMRGMTEQGIDTIISEVTQTLGGTRRSEVTLAGHMIDIPASFSTKAISQTPQKEGRSMPDSDLGGDDLKYVSYSIVFTKRDYETTLQHEQQELVDYATDGGSYGGLKIAEFFERVGRGDPRTPRPERWEASYGVPAQPTPGQTWEVPEDDRKYVKFVYHVDRHLPKGEAEYERDKVRYLREIRDRI
jgi:hypothetical protein